MTTSHFAASPYDWPPTKVGLPKTFENTDLYPAVTVKATRKKVEKFSDVLEREDDLGVCFVAHFEVFGTLVMFYQSALDSIDHWTVFVDMRGCVAREQPPTRLGRSVVRWLTQGAIVPEWVNDEADTEYRSRRRKHDQVDPVVVQSTGMRATKSISSKTRVTRPRQGAANDEFRLVARKGSRINTESGYHFIAKKVATAKKTAVKKATAPAKKSASAKKTTSPKRASAKKATPSKK